MKNKLVLFTLVMVTGCLPKAYDYKSFQLGMTSSQAEKFYPIERGILSVDDKRSDLHVRTTTSSIAGNKALTYLYFEKDSLKWMVLDVYNDVYPIATHWTVAECNDVYASVVGDLTKAYGKPTEEKKAQAKGFFSEATIWESNNRTASVTKSADAKYCATVSAAAFAGRTSDFAVWNKKLNQHYGWKRITWPPPSTTSN